MDGEQQEARKTSLYVRSEFVVAQVQVDRTANGERLRIFCEPMGTEVFLDALELEALTRVRHDELVRVLDPS